MKCQGIKGDQLTYQTMINGCIQQQNVEMGVELLKDASDHGLDLDPEVSQSLLNEINRFPSDSTGLKSTLTSQVLALMKQKANTSYNQNQYSHGYNQSQQYPRKNYYNSNKQGGGFGSHHQSNYKNNYNDESFTSNNNTFNRNGSFHQANDSRDFKS